MKKPFFSRKPFIFLAIVMLLAGVSSACILPVIQINPASTPALLATVQPGLPVTGKVFPTFTAQPTVVLTPQPGTTTIQGNQAYPPLTSTVFIELYRRLDPGVVSIQVSVNNGFQVGQAAGSGFVLDYQGHIITNNHVVSNATSLTVVFFDGTQESAQISGVDVDSDLAVLQVGHLPKGAVPLPLADSDNVQVGEWVMAIGNPFALGTSMSVGIVSATGREIPSGLTSFSIPDAIQTDAAINPGNSGGPLIDLNGQVIGVNAQIRTNGVNANSGVGFAIASNVVRLVAPVLIQHAQYQWPYLGIEGVSVDLAIEQANHLNTQFGAYVDNVTPEGPIFAAGLHGSTGSTTVNGVSVPIGGDVIIAVDGVPISDFEDLLVNIDFKKPGDEVQLSFLRNGQQQTATVILGVRPHNQNQ
jgi:S1-C subfamily serine protease